jgi:hypothetical protein
MSPTDEPCEGMPGTARRAGHGATVVELPLRATGSLYRLPFLLAGLSAAAPLAPIDLGARRRSEETP